MRDIEVHCEGDPRKSQYPDVMRVYNKETGEKWSVDIERELDDAGAIYTAVLKDEKGKRLEEGRISQDTNWMTGGRRRPDEILLLYGTENEAMWMQINSEFKEYQKININYRRNLEKTEEKAKESVKRYNASYLKK